MKSYCVALLLLLGCSAPQPYFDQNYELNSPMSATVGSIMLTEATGYQNAGKVTSRYSKDLIYDGLAGNIIKITYEETANGYTTPGSQREFQYDLSKSKIITWGDMKIEVLDANNERIRYQVLEVGHGKH